MHTPKRPGQESADQGEATQHMELKGKVFYVDKDEYRYDVTPSQALVPPQGLFQLPSILHSENTFEPPTHTTAMVNTINTRGSRVTG